MTDRYLVDHLAKEFPWVKKVYEETSGFIHLSYKHFYAVIHDPKQESADRAKASIRVSSHLEVPEKLYLEVIAAFIDATSIFQYYLDGWVVTRLRAATRRPKGGEK